MTWAHIHSRDLLHWDTLPTALAPQQGGPDAYGCWTGSVIHWHNLFHLFYTGCAEPHGSVQTICHATSRDLIYWEKDKRNPILTPLHPFSTGEKSAWRDPCVIRDGIGFRMLITAELDEKPHAFRGCIAEFYSPNLQTWKFERILFMPVDTSKLECPDLFKIDRRWLLLYSDYGVKAYWSENGHNNWQRAEPILLDNFRYYAAKTLLDDRNRRLCFGFICERINRDDSSAWKWGGISSFPRRISFGEGNEIIVSAVDELEQLRKKPMLPEIVESPYTLGTWQMKAKQICGTAQEDRAGLAVWLGKHPDVWEISAVLDLSGCSNTSIVFNGREDFSSGYRLEINKELRELILSRLCPSEITEPLVLQVFKLPKHLESKVPLRVLFDRTALEIYLNNTTCYSSRVYPQSLDENWWGFYSTCSSFAAENIEVWELGL